jgi:hypothetical protein
MGNIYKLDRYRKEAEIPPFELEIEEGRVISIPCPDGDTVLELSEVPMNEARRMLQILWADQYEELIGIVGKDPSPVLPALAADMLKHFKIGALMQAPGGPRALPR